ncbi:hypothetical protein G7048_28225 (plasmid) [Diaphorobacter sp. HDW4B]|uniref:hypothetical protein n=1 Tax=Diaphorobacter sp. HDW4B TaxID=2714925 RepID=UPI001407F0F6|nr:hypothetical protein [Diaphorobacter sp. HDW4B]QIL74348.1 hypothetical protein G7048_28225 [Diaphorobacter sp. HDW4B]
MQNFILRSLGRGLLAVSCLLSLGLGLGLGSVTHAQTPENTLRSTGPVTLVMSYYVSPANRLAWREEMQSNGLRQLQAWKERGVFKNYRVLVSRHVDSGGWDTMTILTFGKATDAAQWKKVEQTAPAGLSAKALGLAERIETTPVDLVRSNNSTDDASNSVYLAIGYPSMGDTQDYLRHVDGYVVPQLDGLVSAQTLRKYRLYESRYAQGAGRPWATMALLQYKGDEGLASSDAATATVRARLQEQPAWKTLAEEVRKTGKDTPVQFVLADQIALP